MTRRLVFPEPESVLIEAFDLASPGSGEVSIRIDWSLVSTGTEMTAWGGRFDPTSHWGDYVRYPFHPGYSSTGEVIEVGPDVTGVAVGDRIFTMWPHASGHVLPAVSAFPLPDGIDPVQANWAALAGVAYVGLWRAAITPGATVIVIGAGPVGQMAIRWARNLGAGSVLVVDPAESRMALAMAGGATQAIPLSVADSASTLRDANSSKRAPVIIDATGRAATLAEALPLAADFGRVIVLGDTGDPTAQHLTSDVISRGVSVIGAHGNYMPYAMNLQSITGREGLEIEQVLEERVLGWRAFSALFFEQVLQGRFPLDGLITHRMPIEEAESGYRMLAEHRLETMGLAFSWNRSGTT